MQFRTFKNRTIFVAFIVLALSTATAILPSKEPDPMSFGEAASAYSNFAFQTFWGNQDRFNVASVEAVKRTLFLSKEDWNSAELVSYKYSLPGEKQRSMCEKDDIDRGPLLRTDKASGKQYFYAPCPMYAGHRKNCGPKYLSRPRCRAIRIHHSIWQDYSYQARIVDALRNSCGRLRDFPGKNRNWKDLPTNERHIRSMWFWSGCTNDMPSVNEVFVAILEDKLLEPLYYVRVTPTTVTQVNPN